MTTWRKGPIGTLGWAVTFIVFIVIVFVAIIIVPELVCKSDDEEKTDTEPESPSVEPKT